MLNSVEDLAAPVRKRLSADDRRRQLLGIGLTKIMEKPIQDLAMDEIAAEAGISRGLLFHYFPTKTDFYLECLAAAGRRILRNMRPDEDDPGDVQIRTMVLRMVEQIDRRRSFYLTLVHGSGVSDPRIVEVYDSVRSVSTERVLAALGSDSAPLRAVVHAWWAYVEDRALTWSAVAPAEREGSIDELVAHCVPALDALAGLM
jgi:AcrR family transcriptional regulator